MTPEPRCPASRQLGRTLQQSCGLPVRRYNPSFLVDEEGLVTGSRSIGGARIIWTAIALATTLAVVRIPAQQTRRFIYAALPGVGGGNDMKYGGAGILVFDIDRQHAFVRRIPLQGAPPPPDAAPNRSGPGSAGQEAIKGIAANAQTGRLYVSTSRRTAAYDLLTDKLVWEQSWEGRGTDRIALSPDGKTLYAPELGAPKWVVADAMTGALITTVDKPGSPHNTQYSDDGTRVYFEAEGNTRTMSVVDAKTHTIVKEIGPFGNMVRPFTFNGKQTLLFANINDFLGFEVADLQTGQILHHVEVPGVTAGKSPTHGIPSHGIAMTQDEREIWIADNANNYVRIFDATVMPPTLKTSVKVRDEPGWITFGIDGTLAYPSTGDVVDVKTKKIVATLQDETGANAESEKMLEIDFAGGKPSVAGDQFGKGKKR
jgi:DNA-binding beta-propeller fold protein YncE